MELTQDLIDQITDLIFQRLTDCDGGTEAPIARKVTAVFCGGLAGAEDASLAVRSLVDRGCRVNVLFTPNAEHINGGVWLKKRVHNIQTSGDQSQLSPRELVDGTDLVTVPVLTCNSAAKLVHGIADNFALSTVLYALTEGKPVIAAQDACTPRQNTSMAAHTMQNNLRILKSFGVQFVPASRLTHTLWAKLDQMPSSATFPDQRFVDKVLTVNCLHRFRSGVLSLPDFTIITPAARDEAAERGIELRPDGP